jgi:hypothetical protein
MRKRLERLWAKRRDDVRLTKGVAAAVGLTVGTTVGVLMIGFTLLAVWLYDESGDRQLTDRNQKEQVEDIARRVVEIERQPNRQLIRRLERNLTLCRQFDECADALDRESTPGDRRQRRDRDDDRAPDQRADRPPRAPNQPPSTPSPTPGSGGDDPPPPPQTATPVPPPVAPTTPPPAVPQRPAVPKPIVEVDLPPRRPRREPGPTAPSAARREPAQGGRSASAGAGPAANRSVT